MLFFASMYSCAMDTRNLTYLIISVIMNAVENESGN